jgi:hypothetical protein
VPQQAYQQRPLTYFMCRDDSNFVVFASVRLRRNLMVSRSARSLRMTSAG